MKSFAGLWLLHLPLPAEHRITPNISPYLEKEQ